MKTALPAHQASTSCLDTKVLMFSLMPGCAVIAIRKWFSEDKSYKGFHEANMPTVFTQE